MKLKLLQKSRLWLEGLQYAFSRDKNLLVQTSIILGILIGIELFLQDWLLIKQTIVFGLLIILLELINTALELICDFIEPEWNLKIKRIKDIGSSLVALAIIVTVIITLIDIWFLVR